jgi:proline iminopeptidase
MRAEDVERFEAPVSDGSLVGRVAGSGVPVVLLHGGPGLGYDYLDLLLPELVTGYRVAWYQQRGLAPSSEGGPFTVAQHVADVVAVADSLGWDRFVVAGHSWGGHLALHTCVAAPHRLVAGLAIDPLGGVGDGGGEEFGAEMFRRTPEADRERARELDERVEAGDGTLDDALEALRLVWRGYYAVPEEAPPMPPLTMSLDCHVGTWQSLIQELPALSSALESVQLPVAFVHGGSSPIPVTASTDTAAVMPDAFVDVVPGAGHFVWHESPGAVRATLDRLMGRAQPPGSEGSHER